MEILKEYDVFYMTRNWTTHEVEVCIKYADLILLPLNKAFRYGKLPRKDVSNYLKDWARTDSMWQIDKQFLDEVKQLNIITITYNNDNKDL